MRGPVCHIIRINKNLALISEFTVTEIVLKVALSPNPNLLLWDKKKKLIILNVQASSITMLYTTTYFLMLNMKSLHLW